MAIRAISYLKALFSTGKKPSENDFHDFFDSYVHKNEVAEINATVVNTAISNYDTSLKEVTEGGIDTLGDVLKVLAGFNTNSDIKAMIEAAGGQSVPWSSVTARPPLIQVTWDEQVINLLNYIPSAPASYEGIGYISAVRNAFNPTSASLAGKRYVILDLGITNVPVLINGTSLQYYATRIVSVTIGITPKISLL